MVPDVFYNLINFELMKVDKLLIPLLNTIKWSSTGATNIMHDVMKNFNYSEAFIKTVCVDLSFYNIYIYFKIKSKTKCIQIYFIYVQICNKYIPVDLAC